MSLTGGYLYVVGKVPAREGSENLSWKNRSDWDLEAKSALSWVVGYPGCVCGKILAGPHG